MKTALKYLTYLIIYIDRFIVAFVPIWSTDRIDLTYLNQRLKTNAIARVTMLAIIIISILNMYFFIAVTSATLVYVFTWFIKSRIKSKKG